MRILLKFISFSFHKLSSESTSILAAFNNWAPKHTGAPWTARSEEKRGRESYEENPSFHMLTTPLWKTCLARIFASERRRARRNAAKSRKEKRDSRARTWGKRGKDRGVEDGSGRAGRECHKPSIEIRDCRMQPSRCRARVRPRLLVHATVILSLSRLFYASCMRDSVIPAGCIHYDECRARSPQQPSYLQQSGV